MGRKIFQICLLFAAMVLIAFVVTWIFSKPPTPPAPRLLPDPNGYTLLVQAGAPLTFLGQDFRRLDRQQLQVLVEGRSNELQLARAALAMDCQVPLEFSDGYRTNHTIVELSALRRLAQTLAAEGRLAELENRTNAAVRSYLDVARLGTKSAHGGSVIDAIFGVGILSMSRNSLRPLLNSLDAKSCREVAATLQDLDAQRDSWKQALANQREWQRYVGGPPLRDRLMRLVQTGSTGTPLQDAEKSFREQLARFQGTMVDFAARAYELEHNQKARRFADLVPDYLKSIPQDPFTGTNMVFAP